MSPTPPPPLLKVTDVLARLGVSRVTLWAWRRAGRFPAPIRIGPNSIRWRASDVEAWERTRPPA
jgi:prophage regulatory protein